MKHFSLWSLSIILVLPSCSTTKKTGDKKTTFQSSFAEWQSSLDWKEVDNHNDHITYVHRIDTLNIFKSPYQEVYPIPPTWQFKNAFDAVFYNDFFDRVYLDDKVKTIFKDSVTVDSVFLAAQIVEQLMFECDPCNVVGKLHFKGSHFYYPASLGTSIEETIQNYSFEIIDDQTYLFQSDNHFGKIVNADNNKNGILLKSKSLKQTVAKEIISSYKLKEE